MVGFQGQKKSERDYFLKIRVKGSKVMIGFTEKQKMLAETEPEAECWPLRIYGGTRITMH